MVFPSDLLFGNLICCVYHMISTWKKNRTGLSMYISLWGEVSIKPVCFYTLLNLEFWHLEKYEKRRQCKGWEFVPFRLLLHEYFSFSLFLPTWKKFIFYFLSWWEFPNYHFFLFKWNLLSSLSHGEGASRGKQESSDHWQDRIDGELF